jgi:hypothetical protein
MARRNLPVLLLLIFFALTMDSARGDSPTMDEQNHIARGLAYLRTGDPRLSTEHPPLVNILCALPLLTEPVHLPTDDWSWRAGEWYRFADQLLWHANNDAERIVFLARLPVMFLGLLLGAFLYRATRWWVVKAAGGTGSYLPVVALLLYVFDPNILAHSHYVTTDLGGTAFIFLAAAALWRAVRSGFRLGPVVLAGGAYGLALSAKLSAVVFGPIFALLAVASLFGRWQQCRRESRVNQWVRAWLRLGVLYPLSALAVVWAVFGFDWGPLIEGGPAVPMPVFWRGVEIIFDFSAGGRPAFLLGRFSVEGFWNYFPVALAVKTPLPTLLLLAWAVGTFLVRCVSCLKNRTGDPACSALRATAFLLIPAIFYFAVSTQSAVNLGYRHLLPILPFLFAFIAAQLASSRIPRYILFLLLLWLVAGNLLIFPHYLSFFNEIVGPENGYEVLVDSNVDWGQDLKRLRQWMDEQGVERVKLAWFGSAYPDYYGVQYDPLPGLPHHFDLWDSPPFDPAAPEPGVYAISVSNLQELHRKDEEKTVFAWFRAREPDDRVGYSVLIYEVP